MKTPSFTRSFFLYSLIILLMPFAAAKERNQNSPSLLDFHIKDFKDNRSEKSKEEDPFDLEKMHNKILININNEGYTIPKPSPRPQNMIGVFIGKIYQGAIISIAYAGNDDTIEEIEGLKDINLWEEIPEKKISHKTADGKYLINMIVNFKTWPNGAARGIELSEVTISDA